MVKTSQCKGESVTKTFLKMVICDGKAILLLLFTWTFFCVQTIACAPQQSRDGDSLADLESSFNQSLSLVLSDLRSEVGNVNRSISSNKIDRTKIVEQSIELKKKGKRTKSEKRLRRKLMKKKCIGIANKFDGQNVQRKVW
jgi:hypothetical protein